MSGAVSRVGAALALATDDLERRSRWSDRVTDSFWGPLARRSCCWPGEDHEAAETVTRRPPRCVRHEVVQQLVLARALAGGDRERATSSVAAAVQRAAEHGMLQTVARRERSFSS